MRLGLVAALAVVAVLPTAARPASRARVPAFSHVVVIVFENKEVHEIAGNPSAPTFNGLARSGARLDPYHAVAHPSLPNYLALVSGLTHGIRTDCDACTIAGRSLADTLHAAGRTWKTYAEGLPSPGFLGASAAAYVKRHVPFLYFRNVLARPSWRRRVQPLRRLVADVRSGRLPDFSLVVPNLCHDMHDCSIRAGDLWLRHWLPPLLHARRLGRSVVFVLFDEGSFRSRGGGSVAAYAVGTAVKPRSTTPTAVTHYSVLATVEAAWRLPRLGKSRATAPIGGIWR